MRLEGRMLPIMKFFRNNKAATSIEYALIAALISILIIGGIRSVGTSIQAKFYGPIANNL